MNKKQHIELLNRLIKTGEDMKQVAVQNYNAAERSVCEAKAALRELGAPEGRTRKGKYELPDEIKMALKGGLTKVKKELK